MVSLVYEVLWLKELGLLFGNTAYASATTLAVFFAGLSAGGYFWGERAAQTTTPLRVYAWLECGIGLTALTYFLIRDFYYLIYEPLFFALGDLPAVFTLVKFVLAAGLLFLPSFLMGGTLPIMGQYLVRQADQLGKTASMLYAVNTLGAALGVFLAGFYLPFLLGFTNSYLSAIGLNIVIAAAAYGLSFTATDSNTREVEPAPHTSSTLPQPALSPHLIWSIAFLSGFMTLGLEVLWTRMFAQVLNAEFFTDVPLNTDDRPLVEYLAPITHRNQRTKEASWFALGRLVNFYDRLFTLVPPENDPYLRNLSDQETSYVYAGLSFYKAHVYKEINELKKSETFLKDFLVRVPEEIRPSIIEGKH